MNSNMGLFEEEGTSYLEDMAWNVDAMFSAENPSESGFDLSKAAQDFLQGGAFLDSAEMLLNPTAMQKSTSNYISPRGVAENVKQDNSLTKAPESQTQAGTVLNLKTETGSHDERNSLQHDVNANEDNSSPSSPQNSISPGDRDPFQTQQAVKELHEVNNEVRVEVNEAASMPESSTVQEETAETNILGNIDAPGFRASDSQLLSNLHQAQIPNNEDNLDTASSAPVPFPVNGDSTEILSTNNQSNSVTGDPIESLVQLPDHVRFNGDLDGLLPIQALGMTAENMTPQELLLLNMQLSHQELMTISTPSAQTEIPSSTVARHLPTANEQSSLYQMTPEYEGPGAVSAIPEAAQFMQTPMEFQLQSQIPSNTSLHLDNQAMQEVVEGYQSNIHPYLQPVTPDHRDYSQGLVSPGIPAPVSEQEFMQRDVTVSAGLDRPLPVRPTEGIVKKIGRKKAIRDPTKPPPTPKRKKSQTKRESNEDNASGFLVDITGSSSMQRNHSEDPAAHYAPNGFEAGGPVQQHSFETPKRPSTSRTHGLHSPASNEILTNSSLGQGSGQISGGRKPLPTTRTKGAGPSTAKTPRAVDSGRVAKKPGKKGGRVNPETAHLSVEERRSLRAKRNRESAEKSRVRRKIQTAELETSVAGLRDENKSLKGEVLRFQSQLSTMSMEVSRHGNNPTEQEQLLREQTPALLQSLVILQRAINDCPRTFRPQPHSPEIQLKIRR